MSAITITILKFDVATAYSVQIGQKIVSVFGVTSVNDTANALHQSLASSVDVEFRQVIWTIVGGVGPTISGVSSKPFAAIWKASAGTGAMVAVVGAGDRLPSNRFGRDWRRGLPASKPVLVA